MIDPCLKDKVVIITGANHGIGAATARAFADQGARVFVTAYRASTPFSASELEKARREKIGGERLYAAMQQIPASAVADEINRSGRSAVAWEANLAEAGNIPLLFDHCETRLGPVDILVNNHTVDILETFDPARVDQEGDFPVSMVAQETIDAHFMVNARAVALLMAEYVRRYLSRSAREGRIINISTDAAHAHEANVSYAASKHAIESYSRSAASELGKYGITVNIVAPGPIQTGYISPELAAKVAAGTPLGRVGVPSDVADVIVFLASQQAHWMTGQLLYVGGGWRMGQ
jgi:3-oxoacyl-[acyl-carrier protein] reductase